MRSLQLIALLTKKDAHFFFSIMERSNDRYKFLCATFIPDAEPLRDTVTFYSERKTFVLNSA